MRNVAILVLLSTASWAAESPRADILKARRAQFPEVVRIEELAQSVPAEFSAQALLRLAGSDRVGDKTYRKELIEQAFEKAAYASRPVLLKSMLGSTIIGTPAGVAAQTAALHLDRLSLQSRAVAAMVPLDPVRARALFERVLMPVPAKLTCKDALVEDYADYYQAAAAVARTLKGEEATRFFNDRLARISSSAQLAGAAAVLKPENLTMFAAALSRVELDDRTFTRSLGDLKSEMNRLAPQNPLLLGAYRQYLVTNLHAPRCQESVNSDWNIEIVNNAVKEFNAYAGDTPLKPEEIAATATADAYKGDPVLDPAYVETQRARFVSLMYGQGNRGLTAQEKADSAWQQSFNEFLSEIAGMKPNPSETEAAFFYRKGGAWQTVLLAAPAGPERDKVLAQFIAFLQASPFQRENPVEWFASVESLVSMTRGFGPADRAKLLDALLASGHPVIVLYASLEKNTDPRPEWAR